VPFQRGNGCLDSTGCGSTRRISSVTRRDVSKRCPAVALHILIFWIAAQGHHQDFDTANSTRRDASVRIVPNEVSERRAALSLHASVSRVSPQPSHNYLKRASGRSAHAVVCANLQQLCKCSAAVALQRGMVDAITQCGHDCADGVGWCVAFQPQVAQRLAALRSLVRAAAARAQLDHQRSRLERVRGERRRR
jgi:hypothetical protein